MYRSSVIAALLIACLSVLTAAGCTSADEPSAPAATLGVEESVATHDPLPEAERLIGVMELGDGRVRVVGLLQYRADLDGAWLIVAGAPGQEVSPDATVIAWVENMYELDSACSTKGALVYAEGTLADAVAGDPGPALTAEFVARADEPE